MECRGFDSRWYFSMTKSFRPHYGPGVDSGSNRNEYQEYFLGGKGGRCVELTNVQPSCADCLEIPNPQLPRTLRVCPGLFKNCFSFTLRIALEMDLIQSYKYSIACRIFHVLLVITIVGNGVCMHPIRSLKMIPCHFIFVFNLNNEYIFT